MNYKESVWEISCAIIVRCNFAWFHPEERSEFRGNFTVYMNGNIEREMEHSRQSFAKASPKIPAASSEKKLKRDLRALIVYESVFARRFSSCFTFSSAPFLAFPRTHYLWIHTGATGLRREAST